MAPGSHADLEKSEQEREAEHKHKWLKREQRLSIGKGKEAGSTRIGLISNARAHSMHALVNMSVAKCPSMPDLLNQTVPWSTHAQRNDKLKVEAGLTTTNVCAHQSAFAFHHLLSSTLLQWPCIMHLLTPWAFDHSIWVGGLFLRIMAFSTLRCWLLWWGPLYHPV